MKNSVNEKGILPNGYREESPRLAVLVTIVAVILVGAPLAFANKKIGDEGSRAADVSKYDQLAKKLTGNIAVVREILEKGVVEESVLIEGGIIAAKGPTLIIPPVSPTNVNESSEDPNTLNITLSAIYWSPRDPLVTIDNENYHVNDKVKGFLILEIRKTEVLFRSPSGEKVVKYFYDYLD